MIHTARMNIQEDFAADWTSINVNDLDIENFLAWCCSRNRHVESFEHNPHEKYPKMNERGTAMAFQ